MGMIEMKVEESDHDVTFSAPCKLHPYGPDPTTTQNHSIVVMTSRKIKAKDKRQKTRRNDNRKRQKIKKRQRKRQKTTEKTKEHHRCHDKYTD
jgi:hypothetical protein